jgi:hypothetical protein
MYEKKKKRREFLIIGILFSLALSGERERINIASLITQLLNRYRVVIGDKGRRRRRRLRI